MLCTPRSSLIGTQCTNHDIKCEGNLTRKSRNHARVSRQMHSTHVHSTRSENDKKYIHSFGAKTHRKVRLIANLGHPKWQTNVNALRHKVFGDALQSVGDHASLVIDEKAQCWHHGFISRCHRSPMLRHQRHWAVDLSPCQGISDRVSSTLTESCAILHLR